MADWIEEDCGGNTVYWREIGDCLASLRVARVPEGLQVWQAEITFLNSEDTLLTKALFQTAEPGVAMQALDEWLDHFLVNALYQGCVGYEVANIVDVETQN